MKYLKSWQNYEFVQCTVHQSYRKRPISFSCRSFIFWPYFPVFLYARNHQLDHFSWFSENPIIFCRRPLFSLFFYSPLVSSKRDLSKNKSCRMTNEQGEIFTRNGRKNSSKYNISISNLCLECHNKFPFSKKIQIPQRSENPQKCLPFIWSKLVKYQ